MDFFMKICRKRVTVTFFEKTSRRGAKAQRVMRDLYIKCLFLFFLKKS